MAVSHEIKSQLAKLLATEDLMVEHKKVSTASFNVHTRVLTLPMWERASNTVYDLLVGHEVGHALFTPDENWLEKVNIPQQFVNVVEDARIEKLMKRKYMGLSKTFFNGYKELNSEDFFQIADEDISTFNLADKANLYFKIGNFISLDFSPEEMEIIDLINSCETFGDVLIAAENLYKFCKKDQENLQKVSNFDSHQQSGGSETPTNQSAESDDSSTEKDGESNESSQEQPGETDSYGGTASGDQSTSANDDLEVQTASSLEDKIRDLVNEDSYENFYVEIPQVNLDTVIATNSDIHDEIDKSFYNQQLRQNEYAEERGISSCNIYEDSDLEFKKFKNSTQKEVNYLVKEFECRKSADAYARASTSRTGVLDCSKLHTYKYNEDLFKKVTTLADGKNHGLVFVLDWSGSMSDVIIDTCKQLFNLVWFCKKVSIPFEVYAFTNEWRRGEYDHETGSFSAADTTPHYEKKPGLLVVDETFSMMNILTSKVSGNVLEKQMLNVWRLAYSFRHSYSCHYTYPPRLCLSGTPLNESLVSLHQIIPQFQKNNDLQKVHCVILTDGEAGQLTCHKVVQRHWEHEPRIASGYIPGGISFIRDRKMGSTYKIGFEYHEFTDTLLTNLKDRFPHVNFIGIRILEGRYFNKFVGMYHNNHTNAYDKIQREWRKVKSFKITNSGYDAYFGMSSATLAQDSEFEVSEDATKTQIKSAFVKSLKTKKLNKKVLSEFISLVA